MNETSVLDALAEAVYATDAEGRITYFNQAAAEL
jgi:PAS domain-containing protein